MTSLNLSSASAATLPLDVVVVGVAEGDDGLVLVTGGETVDEALGGRLVETLTALGARGKAGEVTRLATLGATTAPTLLATGLGAVPDSGGYDVETLRRATGVAVRALAGSGQAALTLALANGTPGADEVRAVSEGAVLGAYTFDRFRFASAADQKPPLVDVTIVVPDTHDDVVKDAVRRAQAIGRAVALARDLVNTPPGHLHPADLADAAVQAGRAAGLEVEVLDEEGLRAGGYGGILGVGQGSINGPRLVTMRYRASNGDGAARKSVALIGKGITFDSGGLSLKPAQAMEWMKADMGGAAAVIAAMTAIAALQPDVDVTGWVPTAENLPSGTAIRPSDVLTMYGGKTVEVMNTDAEGRLILGDALARASEDSPDYLVDAATLTGAQLVALGPRTTGIMSNDDALRDRLFAVATRAGEQSWPMPLPPELRKGLDSDTADMTNTGGREGGMLIAGLFLKEFVGEGLSWAHLDIAGPAFNQADPHGYTPKGGTGAAVRTFVEFVEDVAANG